MSEPSAASPAGPYVGPRPIQANEPLFGRDKEKADLSSLLRARRVILLHSPSGAGKTSLIQAGLIPLLKGESFLVLPVIRLNQLPPPGFPVDPAGGQPGYNRYLFSALFSLETGKDLPPKKRLALPELAGLSGKPEGFAEYLESRLSRQSIRRKVSPSRTLLIFDQFEEVLTLDPVDLDAKKEFFVRLAPVLSSYSYWAMFAMREDFIAGLEPYLSYFPERLGVRFRLEFLTKVPAMQAIQAPARKYKVEFETDAAQKLVDDLSKITIQEMGKPKEIEGINVEPVQLQVVCKRLWEARRDDPNRITLKDYEALGSVENALRDYYDQKIAEVAEQSGKHELYLREWIERQLITPQKLRNQVLEGSEVEFGLDAETVRLLSNVYLVRAEERRGMTWIELAHDRLVDPILQANAAWRNSNRIFLRTPAELGTNLEDTGWGVIFPGSLDAEPLIDALEPLLTRRREQATRKSPTRYQEFKTERGYRSGEKAQDFLQRMGAGSGQFNPDKVPYYLLIVGSPQDIPYDFQYTLDTQYSVGRIHFEQLEDYRNYALSVALSESGKVRLPNRSVIFAPSNNDDLATRTSTEKLARPLADRLSKARPNWQVEAVLAEGATKERLKGLLGGPETPAVLLTVSHALTYPAKHPEQTRSTGALLCQDWPGPKEWRKPLVPEFYFSAQDLDPQARLLGLVAFLWGSYSGGTPQVDQDGFMQSKVTGTRIDQPQEIAPYAFLSPLPVRMLSHPSGGALAVIGLTWKGYAYSFESVEGSEAATIFDYALERLMQGSTVGKAMEMINQRAALLSARLFDTLQEFVFFGKEIDYEKVKEITQYLDGRDFILIGDPAVRLPVDAAAPYRPPEATWQRPTLELAAVPVPVEAFHEPETRAEPLPAIVEKTIEPGLPVEAPVEGTVKAGVRQAGGEWTGLEAGNITGGKIIAGVQVEGLKGGEITGVQLGSLPGSNLWYFNGLDAARGKYWLPPQPLESFANAISKEEINREQVRDLKYLVERSEQYSVGVSFDPHSLEQAGWGVIFAPGVSPEVRQALEPLLSLRKEQAGERFRIFEGEHGYQPGDTAWPFLARFGLGRGAVDPSAIPYYLLLVGDPGSIPFGFQAELSRRFAVGRLWLESLPEFASYAESVRRAEAAPQVDNPRLALFAPQPKDDLVSEGLISYMVNPLEKGLQEFLQGSAAGMEVMKGPQATKGRLLELLGGQRLPPGQRPDLLVLAGQGMAYPAGSPVQRAGQGGLVCHNWPGPLSWDGPLADEFCIRGQDVDPGSDLCGMLAFGLYSYSLGSPDASPLHNLFSGFPAQTTPAPFVSRLAQRLLGVGPGRGALGVVGLVDHAWSPAPGYWLYPEAIAGFSPGQIFKYVIAELLDGSPVGHSLRPLQQLYALAFVQAANTLEDIQWGKRLDPLELASLWSTRNDLGNLALLGDPAARLNLARVVKSPILSAY